MIARWLVKVALVLRDKDLPVSSANVIEAVRLARTLAALRDRPLAGLEEVTEATRAVLCEGDETLLALVTRELVVGESLGGVPDSAPTVPLEADLRATARRLRLRPEAQTREVALDLRKDNDLARSRLLHRLAMLGVDWGVPAAGCGPGDRYVPRDLGADLAPRARDRRRRRGDVGDDRRRRRGREGSCRCGHGHRCPSSPCSWSERSSPTCPTRSTSLLVALDAKAAARPRRRAPHGRHPAARAGSSLLRRAPYGHDGPRPGGRRVAHPRVRGASGRRDGARRRSGRQVAAAASTRCTPPSCCARTRQPPTGGSTRCTRSRERSDISGLLTGRLTRLLRDADRIDAAGAAVRLGRALSVGTPTTTKAAWIEGFLGGGGDVLVHDRELLGLLDSWVTSLVEQEFTDALPLLRRTFGAFSAPRAAQPRRCRPVKIGFRWQRDECG